MANNSFETNSRREAPRGAVDVASELRKAETAEQKQGLMAELKEQLSKPDNLKQDVLTNILDSHTEKDSQEILNFLKEKYDLEGKIVLEDNSGKKVLIEFADPPFKKTTHGWTVRYKLLATEETDQNKNKMWQLSSQDVKSSNKENYLQSLVLAKARSRKIAPPDINNILKQKAA